MTVSDKSDTEAICPECRDHKCWNCDTTAWDEWLDEPTHCHCWKNGHE